MNKDCITTVKKAKYTGSDFITLLLDGRKEGEKFIPKIVGPKFDIDTALRIRKYFAGRFTAFRIKVGPEDTKSTGPKEFKIHPRSVPARFEFANFSVDKLVGLLGLVGEDKAMLKKFLYNKKPLTGKVFLELMDNAILEDELGKQGMSSDIVSRAVKLQDAINKYGVSISRYTYPNVKFDGTTIIYDTNYDVEEDTLAAAFQKVKEMIDGLNYEKLEKNVEGQLHNEDLRKRITGRNLEDDEIRAILYLGSFEKNNDNYLLHNINFRLENDLNASEGIHAFLTYVFRGLDKLPTYTGMTYFVTPKIVEVNAKAGETLTPSSIIFATKEESDIRAWIDDNPDEYHVFKVNVTDAIDTSVVCSSFRHEVLLPIDASYLVRKVKGNVIELEENED